MRLGDWLRPRYDGPIVATIGGILDRVRGRAPPLALDEDERLDGRCCVVTGANRGLGRAIATELCRRGAHVILACRSGIPEGLAAVRRASGHRGTVEAMRLDLADLDEVERFVDELAQDGVGVDVAVLNAGVVPRQARRTRDLFDEVFQVNFLANVLLVRRLLARGVIAKGGLDGERAGASDDEGSRARPRIVAVSSESHRSAPPIDWSMLGVYRPWGMREALREYGRSKLLLETWIAELARRLRGDVAVHSACPGAVRTDLGREAPRWAKPALDRTMRTFFADPEQGARPVVFLAAARAIEGETGLYLHAHRRKERSPAARDPACGARLWEACDRLLARAGHPV